MLHCPLALQKASGIEPAEGYMGYPTRLAYAKRHKLPTAEQMRAVEASLDNDVSTVPSFCQLKPDLVR